MIYYISYICSIQWTLAIIITDLHPGLLYLLIVPDTGEWRRKNRFHHNGSSWRDFHASLDRWPDGALWRFSATSNSSLDLLHLCVSRSNWLFFTTKFLDWASFLTSKQPTFWKKTRMATTRYRIGWGASCRRATSSFTCFKSKKIQTSQLQSLTEGAIFQPQLSNRTEWNKSWPTKESFWRRAM